MLSNKKKCTDFLFKLSQWAPCGLRAWRNLKEMVKKNSLCWGGQKSASILMLLITMDLADSEGDMANLTKVVEDFLTHTGDFKEKTNLLSDCIGTCYLRIDLKLVQNCVWRSFLQIIWKKTLIIIYYYQTKRNKLVFHSNVAFELLVN